MTETLPEPNRDAESRHTGPITLRDVLRAVFLAPREAPGEPPAPGEMSPHPLPAPEAPLARRRVFETLPAGQLVPASVAYPDAPPEPAAGVPAGRAAVLVLGTAVSLFVAYLAQTTLAVQSRDSAALLLYALASLSWLGLLLAEYAQPSGGLLRLGPVVAGTPGWPLRGGLAAQVAWRLPAAIPALLLSAATYVLTANNVFRSAGVLAWLLSIALWMVAAGARQPATLVEDWLKALHALPARMRAFDPRQLLRPGPTVALVAILAVAAFFRFYRLDAIPVEMTSDHVEKILDAYSVSQGVHSVFFRANGGREAMQFYLVALAADVFGTGMSFLTLKLVSALEGLLLIPVLVLLGREVVDRETGFYAAALVAVSWWHVSLSRLALRIVLTPLLFVPVLVTLIRGVRTGSRRAWVWAGFWMGVGVYGYQALRITPFVAVAAFAVAIAGPVARWLVALLREDPQAGLRGKIAANTAMRQGANLALAGLVALAIFVPMLRVWHDYPRDLWARVVNRTTESEQTIEDQPLDVFAQNYRDALGMFNVRGDVAWISAVPLAPALDRVAGALFVLGLIAWGCRMYFRRDPAGAFLLVAGLIMLLPSALAIAFPIENPSVTRASGTLPIVFLIAASPLALLRQRWSAVVGRAGGTALAAALIAVLLAGSAALSARTYFQQYDASYRGAALNPGQVAAEVREVVGPGVPLNGVWLVGWMHWHDYRAIGIEAGDIGFDNALLDAATLAGQLVAHPEQFAERPLVFIVHPADADALTTLRRVYPQGEARAHTSTLPRGDFVLYVVPEG